jgi:hypothetical protein
MIYVPLYVSFCLRPSLIHAVCSFKCFCSIIQETLKIATEAPVQRIASIQEDDEENKSKVYTELV